MSSLQNDDTALLCVNVIPICECVNVIPIICECVNVIPIICECVNEVYSRAYALALGMDGNSLNLLLELGSVNRNYRLKSRPHFASSTRSVVSEHLHLRLQPWGPTAGIDSDWDLHIHIVYTFFFDLKVLTQLILTIRQR